MKKKKIGIDARFYGPKGKGLGRYVQMLVKNLEEIDGNKDCDYYIFLRKENFREYQPAASNFIKVVADYPWYSFSEQILLPAFLNKYELDLMHFTHFNVPILYRRRFVVTIHDLILFHYPTVKNTTLNKYYYYLKLFGYRNVINSAASRADKIIAVSEFTRQDVIKNLHIDENKVAVTYEGCPASRDDKQESGNFAHISEKYGIMKPYLLYVGNAYPHKNLERLCVAFKEIRAKHPDMNLVLVGGTDYFYRRLVQHIVREKIQGINVAGFVSDVDLDIIYQEALLYVFPSLYEGFGLPPLEALAKGTPVVSSSRTSMPEVLGEAVEYFDPEDVRSIVGVIERVISSERLQREIVEKGKVRLRKFNWHDMAKNTLKIYQEVLGQ